MEASEAEQRRLRHMPFDSVAIFRKPGGRWYNGAVYQYSKHVKAWVWVRDMAKDELNATECQLLDIAQQTVHRLTAMRDRRSLSD